jgi:hypothetical protein
MPAFSRSWTDRFGTVLMTLEGRTGQQHALLIAPLEHSKPALETLQRLGAFKGRITLAIVEHSHATPIREAIEATQPRVVIGLEENAAIITSGAAQRLEPGTHRFTYCSSTGLEYVEPDQLPAWHSRLETVFPNGRTGASWAASVASSLQVPTVACGLAELHNVLEYLFDLR